MSERQNGAFMMDDVFVGRSRELTALHSELCRASEGDPRLVLIEGEPGVGKTVLVWRFLSEAAEMRVLHASGEAAEIDCPFGVMEQLLRGVPDQLAQGLAPLRKETRSSLAVLTAGLAFMDVIAALQDRQPLVVFVDDIQWIDPSSLKCLAFVLRRLRSERVLILISGRNPDEPQPASLARFAVGPGGSRLPLTGLTAADLRMLGARLGAGAVSARVAARLHQHTGGNPLHARALFQELDIAALSPDDRPIPAPRSYAMLVLKRLASCPAEVERLVVAAAILGERCSPRLASELGQVRDQPTAIGRAREAGFLTDYSTLTQHLLSFAHPLIRSAVYHDLSLARRVALHLRAAALVDDEVAMLQHRVAAAVTEDEELASELAAFGERCIAGGQWQQVASSLLAAIRLSTPGMRRERLVLTAAEWLLVIGDTAAANNLIDEIRAASEPDRRDYILGWLSWTRGCGADGEALLRSAWRACDPAASPGLASKIAAVLSYVWQARARPHAAVEWAQRAVALAPPDPHGIGLHGLDVLLPGLVVTGCAAAASLAEVPGHAGDSGPGGLVGRGRLLDWDDDLAGAQQTLRAAVAGYERGGSLAPTGLLALIALSRVEYRVGSWDDAFGHSELVACTADETGQSWLAPYAHAITGWVLAARSEWESAKAHLQAGRDHIGTPPDHSAVSYLAAAEALAAHARGDHDGVLDALGPLACSSSGIVEDPEVMFWRELQVDALVAVGQLDSARSALRQLEARAGERGSCSALAGAARARAGVHAALGEPARADADYRAGLDLLGQIAQPLPFSHGLLQLAYGGFLRRTGKRSLAVAQLTSARARFARLGAQPYVARSAAELSRCGVASARRGIRCADQLTPQELTAAQLAAKGMTNRQVARELVVSVKTVEYHLGNVYAKLGISSRTQLVRRLDADMAAP
jgi:DNA-binding CsgD family transcriptional regulator